MKRKRSRSFNSRPTSVFRWLNPLYVLGTIWGWLANRRNRRRGKWLFDSCVWLALFPWRVLHVTVVQVAAAFVFSWRSAKWRTLWYGMPFTVATVGSLLLVLACRGAQRPSMMVQDYLAVARQAQRAESHKAASLYYERVLQLRNGRDNETLYNIALAAEGLGNTDRVEAIMRVLAPPDEAVYARAHVWQARRLADKNEFAPEDFQRVHSHLRYAVQLDPKDAEARSMLAMYYIRMDRWSQALEHLTIAARQRPDMLLTLARAHAVRGNTVQGKFYGERALAHHKRQCELKPHDVSARLQWADSVTFLEDFPQAVAILTEGLTLKDELAYRQALARVYVTWSDTIDGSAVEARLERLKLIEAGIAVYPDDIMLFDRMMAVLRREDNVSGTAREFLIARIARGEALVVSHLMLGTDAGERGDYEQAIKHLEQAYNLDPNAPIVANNLAWYLLNNDTIDLNRAYELVSALAERWPLMAAIHDTRGQILAKMGRWDEALAELQKGLAQMRGRVRTHEALAEVCEQLGMNDIADEHRNIAASLRPRENN